VRDAGLPYATAFGARLGATHLGGAFDEDGTTFQTAVTTGIASSYASLTPTVASWRGALELRPSGGGKGSYLAWASTFANIAVDFNARPHGDAQRALFQLIIDVRPCGAGPEVGVIGQEPAAFAELHPAAHADDPVGGT